MVDNKSCGALIKLNRSILIGFFFMVVCWTSFSLSEESYLYLVGESNESPERPILMDLNNETIFKSKLRLKKKSKYEVFFNVYSKKFVITQYKVSSLFNVYLVDLHAKKFPSPVFTIQKTGIERFKHSRTVWSQQSKTLCLIGKDNNYDLILIGLKFDGSKVEEKNIRLNEHIKGCTGLWSLSSKVIITGYKNNALGDKEKLSLTVDLDSWQILSNDFAKKNMKIKGNFDFGHLAVTDGKKLYKYDLSKLTFVGVFPDFIRDIYVENFDAIGYYASIYIIKVKGDFAGEEVGFAFVPYEKPSDYRVINEYLPGYFHNHVKSEKIIFQK